MPSRPRYLYWDASVFGSYVGAIQDRLPIIDALLEQVAADRHRLIITSAISIIEVAFASGHGQARRMPPEQEALIDELWNAPHIQLVDATPGLLYRARALMREAVDNGWSASPNDALHLATAIWAHETIGEVVEIHTYDNWARFQALTEGIPIGPPHVDQPQLPY